MRSPRAIPSHTPLTQQNNSVTLNVSGAGGNPALRFCPAWVNPTRGRSGGLLRLQETPVTSDTLAQRRHVPPSRSDRVPLGILFMVGATVMFAVSSALA